MDIVSKSVQIRAGHKASEASASAQHDSIDPPPPKHITLGGNWSSRSAAAAAAVDDDHVRARESAPIDSFIFRFAFLVWCLWSWFWIFRSVFACSMGGQSSRRRRATRNMAASLRVPFRWQFLLTRPLFHLNNPTLLSRARARARARTRPSRHPKRDSQSYKS